jgi:hypothetical protein
MQQQVHTPWFAQFSMFLQLGINVVAHRELSVLFFSLSQNKKFLLTLSLNWLFFVNWFPFKINLEVNRNSRSLVVLIRFKRCAAPDGFFAWSIKRFLHRSGRHAFQNYTTKRLHCVEKSFSNIKANCPLSNVLVHKWFMP